VTNPSPAAKVEFIAAIGAALDESRGFAAGKVGNSEKHWMYQPLARARTAGPLRERAYALMLGRSSESSAGIFPRDAGFYARFNDFYIEQVQQLDFLGLFGTWNEPELVEHYRLKPRLMHYQDQEPDRSIPDDPARCYLPLFAGKRILFVSPFAELLKERASERVFEAVWAKTGKRWFHPARTEALRVPYGWASDTQERYGTSIDLFEALKAEMATKRFDVALIGAGGLGIPLATHAKSLGKLAISLGGHLQVLFGLLGERWRTDPQWQRDYITEAWIDPPEEYRSAEAHSGDYGAYW
jgi:hypothetical protein